MKRPLKIITNSSVEKVKKQEATASPTIYSPASIVTNIDKLLDGSSGQLKKVWKKNKFNTRRTELSFNKVT